MSPPGRRPPSRLLARALAIAAGVALGGLLTTGFGSWRVARPPRPVAPEPPASVPREPAPDVRA